MNAEAVKEEVAEFISDNPDVKMNEIAGRLTDISFKLDLGKGLRTVSLHLMKL